MKLPDIEELLALRSEAHGLGLRAGLPTQALRLGGYRSAHRGRGLEFEEVRPYVAGDDARSIDWRVTARRGRPHTRVFREERERPVWLLVDLQPALFFGTRRQLKSALIVRAAALLAWIAAAGGDRIGAIIVGVAGEDGGSTRAAPDRDAAIRSSTAMHPGRITGHDMQPRASTGSARTRCLVLPPRARGAGVLPILNALLQMQPRAPAPPQPDCLDTALRRLLPLIHPGSLVLALSDFAALGEASTAASESIAHRADAGEKLASTGAALASWPHLLAHSEAWLFWAMDPIEAEGLPPGRFRAGVPGRLWTLDGGATRDRWQALWHQREQRIAQLAQRSHMPVIRLTTHERVQDRLRSVLAQPQPA